MCVGRTEMTYQTRAALPPSGLFAVFHDWRFEERYTMKIFLSPRTGVPIDTAQDRGERIKVRGKIQIRYK